MVTAYDAPSGRLADAAGVDLILVGDSAAMIVLGHDSTVPPTMDEMLVLVRAVARGARAAARRRGHAVRLVPGLRRGRRRERHPLREGGRRGRGQDRGRRPVALPRPGARRRRHPGDGTRRADAAVGDDARRLQGPGPHGREGSAAPGGCARARGGGLLRGRPRGCAGRSRSASVTHAPRPDDRYRRRARTATARCSSGTTCSGSTTVARRGSSSATRTSDRRSAGARGLRGGRPLRRASPRPSTPTRSRRTSWRYSTPRPRSASTLRTQTASAPSQTTVSTTAAADRPYDQRCTTTSPSTSSETHPEPGQHEQRREEQTTPAARGRAERGQMPTHAGSTAAGSRHLPAARRRTRAPAEHPVPDEPVREAGREDPDECLESVEVVERTGAGSRERRGNPAHEGEHDDHVLAVAGGLDGVVSQRFEDLARARQHTHRAARPRALVHCVRAMTVIPSRRLRGIIRPRPGRPVLP